MKTSDIRDYIKDNLSGFDSYTIGRIDTTKDKALCVYNKESSLNATAIGSKSTYKHKKICVLIRYGRNCSDAEDKAQEVYNLFNGLHTVINGMDSFFVMEFDEPVGLGVGAKGIYEYTIDFTATYKEV